MWRAITVLDAVEAVQVGSSFHPADDEISRNAVASVGHGHVLDDLSAQLCQHVGSMAHGGFDLFGQRLLLILAGLGVGIGDAEIVR